MSEELDLRNYVQGISSVFASRWSRSKSQDLETESDATVGLDKGCIVGNGIRLFVWRTNENNFLAPSVRRWSLFPHLLYLEWLCDLLLPIEYGRGNIQEFQTSVFMRPCSVHLCPLGPMIESPNQILDGG